MADALHENHDENTLSKCTRKKTKTGLRLYGKVPAWICEYHQEVLPYIYRAIGSKHLPFAGTTVLHFDSHPDLMAPPDLKADSVCDRELLFDALSIADWILPAVYVGHIKKVIWIKPPWSEQIDDKAIFLHVGRHKKGGTIRVSSCEKYFCEDGLYCPLEELENWKELTVLVMSMDIDHLNSNGQKDNHTLPSDAHKLQNNESNKKQCEQVESEEQSCKNCLVMNTSKLCNSHRESSDTCNFQHFISALSAQLEEPFILDIDMDFFSTLNPFKVMFTKEEFEVLRSFYLFPHCKSGHEQVMYEASQKHQQNVLQLEATLNFLKQEDDAGNSNNMGMSNLSINYKFLEFIKKWRKSRNEPIDYDMVHSAGMTTELPVHITDEPEIIKIMNGLENVLTSLPKPTIITVARSSDDDYTPPQSVDFIQSLLIKCLKKSYKDNVECFLSYKDDG